MMHEELRQRLKLDKRTKSEMLAAAVDLALDAKLLPTKACTDRKLPAGSHTRAKALAARIVSEGLLGLCTPTPDAQQQQPEALCQHLTICTVSALIFTCKRSGFACASRS